MKDRILKRFNDEIAALERELKVDLPKEIQRARELGDLRENAEYKAAKERQDLVNARIAMLKRRVGEISLLNLDRIPHDRAGFGREIERLKSQRIQPSLKAAWQAVQPVGQWAGGLGQDLARLDAAGTLREAGCRVQEVRAS